MQTRREVLAAAICMTSLALVAGCDSEPKPASTATLFNKEEVHNAIQELDSQIGTLGSVEDFDSESWRDVVPRVREGAESIRGALDNLKKALIHLLGLSLSRFPNDLRRIVFDPARSYVMNPESVNSVGVA